MNSKLRFPPGLSYPIAMMLTYILVIAEYILFGKTLFAVFACGTFFIVMGIIQFNRYRMWEYLVLGILAGTSTWHSILFFTPPQEPPYTYAIHILVVLLFIIIRWERLASQERLFANARRLFKLGVEIIDDEEGGYTERPFSAGLISSEKTDLNGLGRYLSAHKIARPFVKKDLFIFAFSMGKSPLVVDDPTEISYISIDKKGHFAIQISNFDYRQYKKKYSFDQLCFSLSEVFNRFISYYSEGNEYRILGELKSK